MPNTINTIRAADGVDLFCRDWIPAIPAGGGPVVFVAGWSMSSASWGYQMMALLRAGRRCIAWDRRGHGRSGDPGRGYDLDTLADDLAAVLDTLDLRGVTLVGHSMGCNEIVRYLSRHGSARVRRVALLGPMTPGIARGASNPDGVDPALLVAFRNEELLRDFPFWIEQNIEPFVPGAGPGIKAWLTAMALECSLQALHDCHLVVQRADMAAELRAIEVPVLLVAGERDVSSPLALTAARSAELIPGARLKVYPDAAHGMFVTHMAEVNADLLEFAAADR